MEQGLVQVYTGEGKGKTTAAFGLAMRAAGRGFRVVILQFLKGEETGELLFIEKNAPGIEVRRFNSQRKFSWTMNERELALLRSQTREGFDHAARLLRESGCDLLILDEVMAALNAGFITEAELLDLVARRPAGVELVLTGRNAPQALIRAADLVTEMRAVKHPFEKGIAARTGIEQ